MTGFNPEVFRWARESAGLEPGDAARAIGIAAASLLTLYLPARPKKGDRGEDFRTVVAERSVEAEADVDAPVRGVLEDDEDARPLDFVGSVSMEAGVPALRASIEQLLGMTRVEYRAQKDADGAFNLLRERAERAGVFVLLVGNLGSHHSTIPVGAFRGFAIADPLAPFIVINDGDAKAAWSFTLLHELAHLFLGSIGVSGGIPEYWGWLAHMGEQGHVKMPFEIFEEVKDGPDDAEKDLLFGWLQVDVNKKALLLPDSIDAALVQKVTVEGYAPDLTDDEVEQIGRDPFLVAYALSDKDRCVVTVETSALKKQRQNRKLPDVCKSLGQLWYNPFGFTRKLGFRTQWKQDVKK